MQVGNGSLQAGNGYMAACNGINAGENIELHTVAWSMQACNGLLRLYNDPLQVNRNVDTVNNAGLQANNGGNTTSKGFCLPDLTIPIDI